MFLFRLRARGFRREINRAQNSTSAHSENQPGGLLVLCPAPLFLQSRSNSVSIRSQLTMKSGSIVDLTAYKWGMNVYVKVPGIDRRATSGLCGNYNGNARDDFKGKGVYAFANMHK